MKDTPQIVGLGLATLDVLIRLKDMPTWEHGTRVSGFCFDGGGLVGTAMVAAARLGGRAGIPSFEQTIAFLQSHGFEWTA